MKDFFKDLGHRLFLASLILGYVLTLMIDWNFFVPDAYLEFLFEENHFFEIVSTVFLFAKVVIILREKGSFKNLNKLERAILFFCIFLIGEENSWGYHLFKYPLGSFFSLKNLRQETNIHNIEIYNGLMVEAIFYCSLGLFILRSFFKKEFREYNYSLQLRIIIFVQFLVQFTDANLDNISYTFSEAYSTLRMNEELWEYTVSYYLLTMNLKKIESVINTEKNGYKAILFYK